MEISIKDDGCGFDTTLSTSRNGLVNMQRRAAQIGASLTIKSEINAETLIVLKTTNHINI
jgi:signal transduction histidine kinase